jgi:hypothetical protein
VDIAKVAALRALLASSGWLDRTDFFARALRRSARTPHGLLIVGPADDEPWHMTAHLDYEARLAGAAELEPTWVRWNPPGGAPAHLSIGIERLRAATRGETLLVVSGQLAPGELLERVHDVRRSGATVFALDRGDPDLDGLAHEALAVPKADVPVSFDAAQHLVSAAVGEPLPAAHPRAAAPRASLRDRLAKLLDTVSGTREPL